MADPREDKIDFQKLERELEAAVESDARYWRENDAKMRAVEQRVETYEQFRYGNAIISGLLIIFFGILSDQVLCPSFIAYKLLIPYLNVILCSNM